MHSQPWIGAESIIAYNLMWNEMMVDEELKNLTL